MRAQVGSPQIGSICLDASLKKIWLPPRVGAVPDDMRTRKCCLVLQTLLLAGQEQNLYILIEVVLDYTCE